MTKSGFQARLPVFRGVQLHLNEISRLVAEGAHAVLLIDRAGWHNTAKLDVPENITTIFLPSRSPELNPVENIWQYLRANWLSNRVFENYEAIITAACDAWIKLIAQPKTITSISMRKWAYVVNHHDRWYNVSKRPTHPSLPRIGGRRQSSAQTRDGFTEIVAQ